MFNVGAGEMIVIALILLMAVGPEQLPGLIRRVGKTVSEVKGMTEGLRAEFMSGMEEIERATNPEAWAAGNGQPSHVKPRTRPTTDDPDAGDGDESALDDSVLDPAVPTDEVQSVDDWAAKISNTWDETPAEDSGPSDGEDAFPSADEAAELANGDAVDDPPADADDRADVPADDQADDTADTNGASSRDGDPDQGQADSDVETDANGTSSGRSEPDSGTADSDGTAESAIADGAESDGSTAEDQSESVGAPAVEDADDVTSARRAARSELGELP